MKNPKSLYVASASRLKRTRQVRNIIILSLAIVVFLALLLVFYVLGTKREMDEVFPFDSDPSSTASSAPVTNESSPPSGDNSDPSLPSDPSETTADSSTDSTETTSSSSEPGSSTTRSKKPVVPPPENDIFFEYSDLLQSVSHEERDIALAKLKQAVKQYIQESPGSRIGFYYINLKNNEEFGNNDLSPFVVGGAINLPINLILYEEARGGTLFLMEILEYEKSDYTEGPGEIISRDIGAQYYIRTLSQLSLAASDNIATAMILRRLGGIEEVSERFCSISRIVDFSSIYNYVDYANIPRSGPRRSSAQDLARYAQELYSLYLAYPEHYQPMINDLAVTSSESAFADSFPQAAQIFQKSGINKNFNSSAEVAIIICEEPIILCVTAESESQEYSAEIMKDLATMVADYIRYCYT
ncbi:MAG: serine hydrolase [Clostridiales bacterium]|nr:serine hydrolase [Clostridiales bacterium]